LEIWDFLGQAGVEQEWAGLGSNLGLPLGRINQKKKRPQKTLIGQENIVWVKMVKVLGKFLG
jgi:hypothetical protein